MIRPGGRFEPALEPIINLGKHDGFKTLNACSSPRGDDEFRWVSWRGGDGHLVRRRPDRYCWCCLRSPAARARDTAMTPRSADVTWRYSKSSPSLGEKRTTHPLWNTSLENRWPSINRLVISGAAVRRLFLARTLMRCRDSILSLLLIVLEGNHRLSSQISQGIPHSEDRPDLPPPRRIQGRGPRGYENRSPGKTLVRLN